MGDGFLMVLQKDERKVAGLVASIIALAKLGAFKRIANLVCQTVWIEMGGKYYYGQYRIEGANI
ncbi:hypothetical protein [Bartonella vinsonii]|uniref:hypothetical protein n=1 Tax=Bartonella vinsonii TaxID=33047 RepID=UPI001260372F|nr:hypothetical protein [Bartonella vinsonii]